MARSHNADLVSAERLRAVLRYEPDTGDFFWRSDVMCYGGGKPAGSIAGLTSKGRHYIGIDGRRYAAHRLAWLYMTGEWPTEIDHKNQDATDNRWANLRLATRSQNNANVGLKSHNTSGLKGVSWDRDRQLWKAQISVQTKRRMLGRFPTKEEAHAAYVAAAVDAFGDFARA